MHRYDESITVRVSEPVRLGDGTAIGEPTQFVWRGRLLRVVTVQRRWVEAGEWWASPQVRAARGQGESAAEEWSATYVGSNGRWADWDTGSAPRGGHGGYRRQQAEPGRDPDAADSPRDSGADDSGLASGFADGLGNAVGLEMADSADLLGETRCWQVEAVAGAGERVGVYQITQCRQEWTLRAVVD